MVLNGSGKRIFKGSFIFTKEKDAFTCLNDCYIEVCGGIISGIYKELPESAAKTAEVFDGFIIPGFTDLHLHAPQYENIGLGMDEELLPWLERYTFPEESRFADTGYARDVYTRLAEELRLCGTTRCVVFGSIHKAANEILADVLEKAGICAFVGKVCMDRNTPLELTEKTAEALAETEEFINKLTGGRVRPIITPRFVPSCSAELMEGLGGLAEKYGTPVQSHLSENRKEIDMVARLHEGAESYAAVYDASGLFGQTPTVMAHCVHCGEAERELIKKNGVLIAHCPTSNSNVASGIAPVKGYLENGLRVGLGSDISAGHTLWLPEVMAHAVQVSKIRAEREAGENVMRGALSLSEVFYMATKAGGSFFGKVGSFERGYEFDALFIDDSSLAGSVPRTLEERLSRFVYAGGRGCVARRFAAGVEI